MPATTPPHTAGTGPWTVHLCVTAACTRCGALPTDEDTGLTPHFDSPAQAIAELAGDWGWCHVPGPGLAEVLLCPNCTAAAGYAVTPRPPAPAATPEPETAQGYLGQPGDGLSANTRCFPPAAGERAATGAALQPGQDPRPADEHGRYNPAREAGLMPRTIVNDNERMILHDNGQVERPAVGRGPSPDWVITGAETLNNFGTVTRTWTLAEILRDPGAIPWEHANGTQKTHLTDRDHGTSRRWGGTRSHHVE